MRTIIVFLIGVAVGHAWNNPELVDTWKTIGNALYDDTKSAIHAATEE